MQAKSSKYASLCYHTAMAVVLVTGPGAAIAIALVGVHMWCISRAICLESLLRPRTYENSRHQSSRKGVERTLILVGFALHGRLCLPPLFFSSQHRLDFGSLQLEAGFVGLPYFNYYYAGAMLALNTFGPDLLVLLALYLALASKQEEEAQEARMTVAGAICLYRQAIVLVSSLTALVLRRHLMVWAIFAPKLAFEASLWMAQTPWLIF